MKRIYIVIFLFANATIFGQAPNWQWAKSAGDVASDWSNAIDVDTNGNSYITGDFYSSAITFGSTTLTNTNGGNSCDFFIAKYDVSGNVLWAKSAIGSEYDYGYSIAVDISGNSFVTGYFSSTTITFGSTTLTKVGVANTYDFFVIKYDPFGNVLWAKSAGGINDDQGFGIAVDANGNTFITGMFASPNIIFGSDTLTNTSLNFADIFIVKYDSSGNVIWAKSAGGTDEDYGTSIAVDVNGNPFVTGDFISSSIIFGSSILINTGGANVFIVRYDSSGNVQWSKSAGGTLYDNSYSITVNADGNAYIIGSFSSSTITFDSTTLTKAGSGNTHDIFVVRYDSSGNALWAKSAGGIYTDVGRSITIDASGNSYIMGSFSSPSINFGTTTLYLVNSFWSDIFLAKYDSSGNVLWAKSVGGNGSEDGLGIAIDESGNSYITGQFTSTALAFGSTTLTNNSGGNEIFIAKLNSPTGIVEENNSSGAINIYPNPTTNTFTITFLDIIYEGTIEIYNVLGEKVFSQQPAAGSQKQITVDVSSWNKGIYFVKASVYPDLIGNGEKQVVKKVVVQ